VLRRIVLMATTAIFISNAPGAFANGYYGYVSSLDSALQEHIQVTLLKKGFDPGPVDGIFGRRSYEALMRFRASEGIIEGQFDEILTPLLIRALFDIEVDPGNDGDQLSPEEERALMERLGFVYSRDGWQARGIQVPD